MQNEQKYVDRILADCLVDLLHVQVKKERDLQ